MNHRPLGYRRSVYRRRRIRTVLIVLAVALVVLFLLFLWIGNLFSDKLAIPEDDEKPQQTEDTTPPLPAASLRKVQAPVLSLREGNSQAQAALNAAAQNGASAVSVALTDRNGSLLYHSEVAERLAIPLGRGSVDLSSLGMSADGYGVYLCGSFTLQAADEENALDRSVYLSEAAAVVVEAFEYGMRDIVLRAPALDDDSLTELVRFAETVKGFVPNAVLGLSLPDGVVSAPDAKKMEELAYCFDYLALDLCRYGEGDPVGVAEAQTDAMLYYLLRYHMRVLIPAEAQEDVIAKLNEFNVTNWMVIE